MIVSESEEKEKEFRLFSSNLVFGLGLLAMLFVGVIFIFFGRDYLVDSGRVLFAGGMVLFLSLVSLAFLRLQTKYASTAVELRRTLEEEDFERTRTLTLINSIKDAVILVDDNFYVRLYNAATLDLFDTNINISGKPVKDLFSPDNSSDEGSSFNIEDKLKNMNGHESFSLVNVADNGEKENLSLIVSKVKTGYGKVGMRGYVILAKKESSPIVDGEEETKRRHDTRNSLAVIDGSLENALVMIERGQMDNLKRTLDVTQKELKDFKKRIGF